LEDPSPQISVRFPFSRSLPEAERFFGGIALHEQELDMDDHKNADKPTVISPEDARGALGPKAGTIGDTLLPTLIGVIVLSVIAVGVVAFIVWP
jgi:hypothetical protein